MVRTGVINSVPGNTTVATFSSHLKLDETNCLDIEVSGLAHKYNKEHDVDSTLQQGSGRAGQWPNTGNFIQQMAFTCGGAELQKKRN